ncbi:uncharacterized protein [Sagmatias obliquidens]|uniref:uncharacterized protein n=1 Tax=Sagmatias obliquidens TaxID=3371155 RepID=UPI000F441858|nr:uncharacterized protein LOC113629351 [Lagenorhynchus obliquidens]
MTPLLAGPSPVCGHTRQDFTGRDHRPLCCPSFGVCTDPGKTQYLGSPLLSSAERANPGLRLDLPSSQRPPLFLLLDLITTNAELPATSWFEQEDGEQWAARNKRRNRRQSPSTRDSHLEELERSRTHLPACPACLGRAIDPERLGSAAWGLPAGKSHKAMAGDSSQVRRKFWSPGHGPWDNTACQRLLFRTCLPSPFCRGTREMIPEVLPLLVCPSLPLWRWRLTFYPPLSLHPSFSSLFLSTLMAVRGLLGHLCHHKLMGSKVCSVEHLLENVPPKKKMDP